MTDLVAVAGNAVAAYQRALGTVSNNIANVSTDGYSRQEITLEANPVSKVGNIFLGTGVIVNGVKRQYDSFTEANLRNSNSDLASQGPMVNYANRVIDVMGGATTGLTTALDQFFTSARDLSSEPASTVLRSSFVRDAQGLTSRFGELSSQLDMVQTETDQAIQSNVSNMNTICGELANVNKQLTKVQTEAAQPPDLLDQRDKLLRDLSAYAHVNASFTVNGTVTVSLGASFNQDVVVQGNSSKLISATSDPQFPGKTNLILDQYGTPSTLSNITSGSLSGLLAFQEQVLSSSRSALDNLATTLSQSINNVHEQGIDGYGKPGGALFSIDPTASSVAGGLRVAFDDPMKVSAAAQFRVIQSSTNTGGGLISLKYDLPAAGAAAEGPSNLQDILVNNDNVSAGRSITIDPSRPAMAVATVLNGMQDVSIFLDNAQVGQQLQVMTRDGRQVLGASINPTSLESSALLSTKGMAAGAQLSADYLNKSGDTGYKDMTVFYGVRADVQQEPIYNDAGQSLSSKTLPASITSTRINPDSTGFASGMFVLNGVSLGALTVTAGTKLQAKDVADWLKNADTGLAITASNEVRVPDKQLYLGAGLAINGKNVGTPPFSNKQALINAINATPNVGVFASMDLDGSLVIRNTDGSNISIENQAGGVSTNVNALGLPSGIIGGTVTMTQPLRTVATVNASQVNIPANQLNLGYPLNLYGSTISKPSPGFTSITDLAAAINTAATGVSATVTNGVLNLTKSSDVNGVIASLDSNGALTISSQSNNTKLINGTVSLARPLASSTASTNINQVKVPANQINLLMPLAINGQTIFKPSTGFGTSQGLADAINKAQTVVKANLDIDGNLILSSTNGPDNNSIQIATDSAGTNATGNALGVPAQTYRSAITDNTSVQVQTAQTDIELGFGSAANHGTPADLKQLGFRTGAYIKGATNEDLLVFVTGAGSASVAASYSGTPVDARQSLRAQPLEVSFTSATHYRIRDINTDTIVAERDFDPNASDLGVSYQGLRVSFTTPPETGDKFNIDGNADGTGNNENILDLAAIESKALVGNKTLSASYIDHVNIVGNISRQATIAQTALKVVHDQAVKAKDQVSGVSLDQEAADLIRYQQAYQAAAKVIQVGSQLFDSILQLR
jgi:flagellar hook-associated protein FlgK